MDQERDEDVRQAVEVQVLEPDSSLADPTVGRLKWLVRQRICDIQDLILVLNGLLQVLNLNEVSSTILQLLDGQFRYVVENDGLLRDGRVLLIMAEVLLVIDRAGIEDFGLQSIQESEQMAVVVEYHIYLAVHVDVDEVEERDLSGLLAGALLLRAQQADLRLGLRPALSLLARTCLAGCER